MSWRVSEYEGRTRGWRDDAIAEAEAYEDFLDEYYGDPPTDEEWTRMPFYPDYDISTYGRVWSNLSDRLLRPYLGNNGYYYVNLRGGARYRENIHWMVATAFIPNDDPFHKYIVRHLDDIRTNNHVSNLAWGTPKDNTADARRNGRITYEHYIRNLQKANEAVRRSVRLTDMKTGKTYDFSSGKEAAEFLGVHPSHICIVLKGRYDSIHGYLAEYTDGR